MAYVFNPTPAESGLLSQIAGNESGGNYTATNPASTASGAYQFINSTWQMAAQATGVGTEYASAASAPAWMQDTNALWLLRAYGPNSTISWAASGPYGISPSSVPMAGGAAPLVDLSGAAASTSTADILNQMGARVGGALGTDATTGGLLLAAGIAAAALALLGR